MTTHQGHKSWRYQIVDFALRYLVWAAIAVGFLAWGATAWAENQDFKARARAINAQVLAASSYNQCTSTSTCTTRYAIRVRYTTSRGGQVTAKIDTAREEAAHAKPGTSVTVYYDPTNPHHVQITTGLENQWDRFGVFLAVLTGLALLGAGLAELWLHAQIRLIEPWTRRRQLRACSENSRRSGRGGRETIDRAISGTVAGDTRPRLVEAGVHAVTLAGEQIAGGHPPRRRRVVWMLAAVAFVLTPWLTFGFATPIGFLAAALAFDHRGRATTLMLWGSTVGYFAALIVGIATADAANGSAGATAWTTCWIITMPLAGLHAVVFSVWAATHSYRPGFDDEAARLASWRSFQLGSRVSALAFSADGCLLTVGCRRQATVFDLRAAGGAGRGEGSGLAGGVSAVALSRDGGRHAWAAGFHGQVTVHDLATRAEHPLDCRAPGRSLSRVTAMAFDPDATRLVTATGSGHVAVRNLPAGTAVVAVRHGRGGGGSQVNAVSFSPNGRLLATGGSDGRICVWDGQTGAPRLTIDHPDSRIVTGPYGGSTPPAVTTLAFCPDGGGLAAGSHETVACWPIAATPRIPTFRSRPNREGHGPTAIAFSPDGTLLAAAHKRGSLRLWNLRPGEPSWEFPHRSGWTHRVTAVTFSPDGALLAVGTRDGTVCLWRLARVPTRLE